MFIHYVNSRGSPVSDVTWLRRLFTVALSAGGVACASVLAESAAELARAVAAWRDAAGHI